ncbi:MAG TPA: Ig domain-containing protein, partial [Acidimicrobiales bacterium]|nr:Ig domain-containing protein [Acidimicrobiales bacterium]
LSPSSVNLGGSVTDTATVTGTAAGGAPTGDVTFYACQTSTAKTLTTGSCPPSDPPIATATLAAGEGDTSGATSAPFIPTSDGTWCFSAVYGGDDSYVGSADDTSAADLDPHECVLVSTAVGNPFRITTSSLPSATVGASYRAPLTVSGGTPPYTWKVEAGALPKGLKLNKGTGIISGKPHRNDNRSSTFTVMVTEGKGKAKKGPQETATKVLTIIVSS